jgi:hypothetical protein
MTLDQFLSRFPVRIPDGNGFRVLCPAHADQRPSLAVAEGDDGRILLRCRSRGCTTEAIVSALGLTMASLFPSKNGTAGARVEPLRYIYRDEEGRPIRCVCRLDSPKGKLIWQERSDGKGGWTKGAKGARNVPYRLDELVKLPHGDEAIIVEGEKCVEALVALGFQNVTTNAEGAGKWKRMERKAVRSTFCRLRVLILPDNDEAGRSHAAEVAADLSKIALGVRILELPGLEVKGDVVDWIARMRADNEQMDDAQIAEELKRLAEAAPAWTPPADQRKEQEPLPVKPRPRTVSGLPEIKVNDRHLRDKTADALSALETKNSPPKIFVRVRPVRFRSDEHGRPFIEDITHSILTAFLARAADFISENGEGERVSIKIVDPPGKVVEDILAHSRWPFPPLERIVEVPQVRPDGSILATPGYDPSTSLFYSPAPGFVLPEISDSPNEEEATHALELVDEALGEFPFADGASRANVLGALLTPIVRTAIDGPVPLGLLDKPQRGTGASLLAEVISLLATGRLGPFKTMPEDDDEVRKFITSTLLEGSSLVIIDNVERPIASSNLAAVLTANAWTDRILGRSENTPGLPARVFWLATGNNITLRGDIARRAFWIRLDAKSSKPWERGGFRHPDLLGWVKANRPQLIAALFVLVRRWVTTGRPGPAEGVPVMGGFDSWRSTIGGILTACGRGDHFLGNARALHEQVDEEAGEWETFLAALHAASGGASMTAATIASWARGSVGKVRETLPGDLLEVLEDSKKSFSRRLGWALRQKRDVRHGAEGLRVEMAGDSMENVKEWRIAKG